MAGLDNSPRNLFKRADAFLLLSRGKAGLLGDYFSFRERGGGTKKVGFFDPRYRGRNDGRPKIPTGQGNASKPQQRLYPLMDPIRSWKPPIIT